MSNGTTAFSDSQHLSLVRRVLFPHIVNDDHWDFVVGECQRIGVHPADVRVLLRYDAEIENVYPELQTTAAQ